MNDPHDSYEYMSFHFLSIALVAMFPIVIVFVPARHGAMMC